MRLLVVAVACACACSSTPAPAPVRVSSPGPLSASHGAIDNQLGCNDCHVSGTAAIDRDKCLACHDALALRLLERKGLHATARFRDRACESCHREHRGRGFDPRGWLAIGGEQQFDHARAGLALRNRHAREACGACHPKTNAQGLRTYLGARRACASCHDRVQPHRTLLACDRCHTDARWAPAKPELDFEHPGPMFAGAHAAVACVKCHVDRTFPIPRGACSTCHASPHAAAADAFVRLDCERCHSHRSASFRTISFDHAEHAGVGLGAHKKLACRECHATATAPACAQCHVGLQPPGRAVSPHGNRFLARTCQSCHRPSTWRSMGFDHARTGFPLRMQHARTPCRACHRGASAGQFEDLSRQQTCTGCHEHARVHDAKYRDDQCRLCHTGF